MTGLGFYQQADLEKFRKAKQRQRKIVFVTTVPELRVRFAEVATRLAQSGYLTRVECYATLAALEGDLFFNEILSGARLLVLGKCASGGIEDLAHLAVEAAVVGKAAAFKLGAPVFVTSENDAPSIVAAIIKEIGGPQ